MYLELRVTISKPTSNQPESTPSSQEQQSQQSQSPPPAPSSSATPSTPDSSLNCTITYTGVSPESIDLSPSTNLLTRTSLYLLRCHGHHTFPHPTTVHIHNPIPLGRGLGSSGAAVVAGILLGNLAADLSLPKSRLLDYCLMIERHPDNVAAALYGGFVGTYLNELDPADMARKEIPLSEVLHAPVGGVDTGLKPPEPPVGIGHFRRFGWAKEIKAVVVIPDFEVSTARARECLPTTYSRQDMVSSIEVFLLHASLLLWWIVIPAGQQAAFPNSPIRRHLSPNHAKRVPPSSSCKPPKYPDPEEESVPLSRMLKGTSSTLKSHKYLELSMGI
jgi:homoserine kinase